MSVHSFLTLLLVLHCIEKGESRAVPLNTTRAMRFYVVPMTKWEVEAIQRQSRQQQGTSNSNTENNNGGLLAPAGTASNVVNILSGLFNEDVRPIVAGGTAFIPEGGLREGVNGLLQGLAPALQQILFGTNSNIPQTDFTLPTAAPVPRTEPPTSPRPRRRTTISPDSTSPGGSPLPDEGSEEETELPTAASSIPPLPSSSSLQPITTSAESDEETEASIFATSASPVATPASPQANDPVTPESPQSQPELQATQPPSPPQSPPTPQTTAPTTPSGNPATPSAAQLKVVLEDTSSIVTANVVSNVNGEDKQYIYLVLLPEQYEQLDKLQALSQEKQEEPITTKDPLKQSEPQQQAQAEVEIIEPPTTTHIPVTTTHRSSGYRTRNKNRTTTIPPPHLQLQYYYRLTSTTTSTTTTTTTPKTTSTDLPGVQGFENEDDELEN